MGLNMSSKSSLSELSDKSNDLIVQKIKDNEEYIIFFCNSIDEFHLIWKSLKIPDIYCKTVPYSFSMKGHQRDDLWNLAVIDLNQKPIKIELLKDKTLKSKMSSNKNLVY